MTMDFCSLVSGSSGNCQFIQNDNTKILVDAGLSGKKIQEGLSSIDINPSDIDGILITHEHSDHIKGAGILSRRFDIPIYANEGTWEGMEKSIGNISDKNIFIIGNNDFEIGSLGINPFKIHHDCNDPLGFSIFSRNKKASILTDTGIVDENIMNAIRGSDILMVESNHDVDMLKVGSYPFYLKKRVLGKWGHLSNEDAGKIITETITKEDAIVILGHLSLENNFPELALETVRSILDKEKLESLKLNIASRFKRTDLFSL